ncbi:alcohol dehydrogenase catalytic domain-containing protein, partial [Streptomyces sp. NPDC022067]|uniref:alcohol dehydrogenase catalytic domain-containing protein n=1 Tax=Streptomyces sp. NPDC022067 TaxID=3154906 RepID=UPI0033DC9A3E
MKAITLQQYGGPEDLELTELATPKVAPGEVLVRVKAAGVNPADWKVAAGYLDEVMEAHFPFIPGWEVSGVGGGGARAGPPGEEAGRGCVGLNQLHGAPTPPHSQNT